MFCLPLSFWTKKNLSALHLAPVKIRRIQELLVFKVDTFFWPRFFLANHVGPNQSYELKKNAIYRGRGISFYKLFIFIILSTILRFLNFLNLKLIFIFFFQFTIGKNILFLEAIYVFYI